jgi:hypothetical protein
MLFNTRVYLFLQRSLLACVLASPILLAGCGGEDSDGGGTRTNNGASTDEDEDGAEDGEPSDDGDDTQVAKRDAGNAGKKDAGSTGKRDAGDTAAEPDAGDGAGKPDGGKASIEADAGNTSAKPDAGVVNTPDAGGSTSPKPGEVKDAGSSTPPKPDAGQPVDPDPVSNDPAPTEASATAKGPLKVTTYISGYPDAPEYADSTMHYPEGDGPWPAIAIVPGFVSPQASIQAWGPFLASHGIVTLTIGTNLPTDDPNARATALWAAIGTIKGENTREGSPLKGKLDLKRLAVAGWSMGGGGALLTGQAHPELKAIIAFCPWSPGSLFLTIRAPTLFLAAQNDTLAGGQSQGFYNSIPFTTPKMLWERAGATHFENDPTFEMGAQGRYGLSWLKTYLVGDERYKQFLLVKAPNASDFQTNVK